MNLNIEKEFYDKIIESVQKAMHGERNVKLDYTGDTNEISILTNTLNDLFKHITKITDNFSKAGQNTGSDIEEPETHAYFEPLKNEGDIRLTKYIMDKADEIIYGLDSEGNIIYANEAAIKSLEYTKEEMAGKKIFDIDPAMDIKEWAEHWNESRTNKFSLFETKHKTKSGKIIPVEVSIDFLVFNGREYHSSFVRDITDRKKAEETLLITQYAFDSASIGIIRTGKHGEILSANKQVCKNLGYSLEELLNMHVWQLDPEFPVEVWQEHRKFLRKKESTVFETYHRRKDGSVFPVEINSNYRVFNGNEFSFSFIKDLTEQKHAKSALEKSEYLLKESQRVARLGHYVLDAITGYWNGSDVLYDILGIDKKYYRDINGWTKLVHSDFSAEMSNYFSDEVLKKHIKFDKEYKIIRPDNGSVRWVHGLGEVILGKNGNVLQMIGTIQDITVRKQAEEELKASLKEKEVLLKELYHRTKNNMQVIRAMLAIKSAYSVDDEVKKNYLDMENKILTMSLVHQKLYQSHNLSSIDLKEYIEELVPLLMTSYNISEERIKVNLKLNSTPALIDTAIPCGLIINELLSNSLQHAFPDKREGEIKISLSGENNKTVDLCFSDNGVGVPNNFNFRDHETLGLQSIFTIAEHQLQGKAVFRVNNGIECKIQINNSLYSPRV